MDENGMHHRELSHLTIEDTENGKRLSITVGFLRSFLEDFSEYYFVLQERDTEQHISLSTTSTHIETTISEIRGELQLDPHLDAFKPEVYWDLYLHTKQSDQSDDSTGLLHRIKMNASDIRLHSFIDRDTLFLPYRTKNGNVSFRKTDHKLLARLDEIELEKENVLSYSGYAVHTSKNVIGRRLILTNNINEEEIALPLNEESREDLDSLYSHHDFSKAGFHGTIQLQELKRFSTNNYYKFYLEVDVLGPDGVEQIRSPRLDFYPRNPEAITHSSSIKVGKKQWKVYIKPTKKSRYLSLRIYEYNLLNIVRTKGKNALIRIKNRIKGGRTIKKAYKLAFVTLGKLPAKKKQVVFESFLGKQYSCNPRAIYEYMLEHHPEYDMYWSIDPRSAAVFEGKGLKTINRFSIPWLFKMTRSKYWVSNSRLPIWIPKPNHTTYLQTWHGTPLKRLAADMDEVHMPGTNTVKYKRNFLMESSRWDYLISPNRYSSEIFARAFGFEKDMIESGYPRNDFLHNANNEETMDALKNRLDIPLDKKVILYAPTWRDNEFYAKGKYKFNLKLELDKMQEELGDEYIVLLRMHYLIAENLDITPFGGFAYDVSHHTDISELYLISDLLITDYSSVFFDYANLGRPMIFYVYDIENYRDTLRGFYFDFEAQAPGPLVKTTEDVIRHIQHPDPASQANFDAFYQKFCYLEDGEASKRVVEKVFKTK